MYAISLTKSVAQSKWSGLAKIIQFSGNGTYTATNEGITLGSDTAGGRHNKYAEAASWLSDNIREADCMDWEADIDDLEFESVHAWQG